ncbi:MAG: hypothetical protein WCP28_14665 [Actinomycetes bacterium]
MSWYVTSLGAGAATRGMPFLALLVFARQLGPNDFAQVSMLAVASAWLTLLASGGLEFTAMFEERRRLDGRAPRALVPAWFVAIPVSVVAGLCFILFALLVGFPMTPWFVMVCSAVVMGLTQLPILGRARIRHDRRAMITFVVVPFTVSNVLRISALLISGDTSSAAAINPLWLWVAGDITQALLVLLLAVPTMLRIGVRLPSGAMLREGLGSTRKSGPWVVNAGLQGALANLDKFLLFGLVSAEAFGVYALSYQLANIANILVSEYNKARLGRIVRNHVAGTLAPIRAETLHYLAVLVIGGLFSVSAAFVLFRTSYPDIVWLTAILVASVLPIAWYVPLENQVSVIDGRTTVLAIASLVGVVVGAAVLLSLVALIGVVAGVVGTAAGYVSTTAVLWWFSTHGFRVGTATVPS